MAQTAGDIRNLLASANTHPKHRFGQNFMVDGNLVRLIADAGELSADDTVIEVGPGTGTLTEELLSRCAKVVAFEIDRDLSVILRRHFADRPTFELLEGDALKGKHELRPEVFQLAQAGAKLVANLPYNIASPLVVELLIAGCPLLAFTVQREVAERMAAGAGQEAYGPLGVVVQSLAEVEILRHLPPTAFWPRPTIDSSLVRLRRRDQMGEQAAAFSRFVAAVFSRRRKTLRNALQAATDHAFDFEGIGIDPTVRPEVLTVAQLQRLFRASVA